MQRLHKSQGSTLEYFLGDLDQDTGPTKKKDAPCGPGMFYTMLSRGKSRDRIKLRNFKEEHIVVNDKALIEMERMRTESVLEYNHPLKEMNG